MNLQIPFSYNMAHHWITMIVMSIFPSGIQQWELDSAAATKQQLYLVEIMHAAPKIGAEVALAPIQ
jgi:hypothetical protein